MLVPGYWLGEARYYTMGAEPDLDGAHEVQFLMFTPGLDVYTTFTLMALYRRLREYKYDAADIVSHLNQHSCAVLLEDGDEPPAIMLKIRRFTPEK